MVLCHLQPLTVLLLPFQSEFLLFLFILWLLWIEIPKLLSKSGKNGHSWLIPDENALSSYNLCLSILFFKFLFRAATAAYGSSQARGWIGAPAAGLHLQPQQHRIQVTSVACAIACGKAWSLTHWARPGMEPASLWIPIGFLIHWTTKETPNFKSKYILKRKITFEAL